jgi:uncharacterized membrane protein YcaP (DUF421 family)
MGNYLFNNWSGIFRVFFLGVSSYIALLIILRISGKRTLSKLNAFDLVITVALGSTLSTIVLSKNVSLSEGVLALALLVLFQFIVTWFSVRSGGFQHFIKAQPRMLLYKGEFLEGSMIKERVTKEEILAAMRGKGYGDPSQVQAVVLETDGTLSIIGELPEGDEGVLTNVVKNNMP